MQDVVYRHEKWAATITIFLNLGAGRMGIVLADIVGKGIPGTLLMANLQADVQPVRRRISGFATISQIRESVFFREHRRGKVRDAFLRRLSGLLSPLALCQLRAHPPLLVRSNGTAERLTATATVLGLFEEWESSLGDVQITGGDVLVIYTDGITEANNADGEEFGESRLLETIRRHLAAPVPLILDAILRAALEFSGGEGKMRDDLTLVVARGREGLNYRSYAQRAAGIRNSRMVG